MYQWTGPFEGWARWWVSRHFWRVRHLFQTPEDALQECAVVFVRCVNKYADTVDEPRWMMALFKTSVANAWAKFSVRDREQREALAEAEGRMMGDAPLAGGAAHSAGPLLAALSLAPIEAVKALHVMAQAPQEVLDMLLEEPSRDRQNSILRRWCRLPKGTDVLGLIQSSLG